MMSAILENSKGKAHNFQLINIQNDQEPANPNVPVKPIFMGDIRSPLLCKKLVVFRLMRKY